MGSYVSTLVLLDDCEKDIPSWLANCLLLAERSCCVTTDKSELMYIRPHQQGLHKSTRTATHTPRRFIAGIPSDSFCWCSFVAGERGCRATTADRRSLLCIIVSRSCATSIVARPCLGCFSYNIFG